MFVCCTVGASEDSSSAGGEHGSGPAGSMSRRTSAPVAGTATSVDAASASKSKMKRSQWPMSIAHASDEVNSARSTTSYEMPQLTRERYA
eukprot:3274775-Pleurochrysis_carterae.AAC.1